MLINIEGTDASGKQTQTKMLVDYYKNKGIKSQLITFPNYQSDSSALVKMYLKGDFGEKPDDINPKIASIFFACDRYASFKTDWSHSYEGDTVIVADRYTSSNIIHQASKIDNFEDRMDFVHWLYDLEYNIFGIPKPDIIIFLNMPIEVSIKLMENRANKISGDARKDIHESSISHLKKSNQRALEISSSLGWHQVDCVDKQGCLKSKEQIHYEIIKVIEKHYE